MSPIKVRPDILADSKLKEEILNKLVKDYNLKKEFRETHKELLDTYADIKLKLFAYTASIPSKKVETYRELKTLEVKFFIHLHELLSD